jgi:5-methylcytosine-specific restriction endonuclease McrA
MNWNNHGKYNAKTWDDNDPSTWTWQVDHIIPRSDLPYTSMEDDNFKKCWSLDNLRPLSAKQNIIEGSQKIRHLNIGATDRN